MRKSAKKAAIKGSEDSKNNLLTET